MKYYSRKMINLVAKYIVLEPPSLEFISHMRYLYTIIIIPHPDLPFPTNVWSFFFLYIVEIF